MPPTPPLYLDDLLRERRWLVGLSRHLIASASDAEDVAQEALMRAIEHGDRIPEQGRRSWLAATARNIALASNRGTYRRISRERNAARAGVCEELAPDELVATAEFQARAANAVVALPDAERTIVVLRFYEGLTTAQIAERLDVKPDAARQRLSRAIRRLRFSLDEKDSERTWGTMAALVARRTTQGTVRGPGSGFLVMAAGLLAAVAVAFTLWAFAGSNDLDLGTVELGSVGATESEAPSIRLSLSDPTQPSGFLQDFGSPPRQARLYPDLLPGEVESDVSEISFVVPTSGVVTLSPKTLRSVPGSATLVVEGYDPMTIDFAAEENGDVIVRELAPRRRVRVTLEKSPGSPSWPQLYHVAATSAAWSTSERELSWTSLASSLGSDPHLQVAKNVNLGETFEFLDTPGSKVWFYLARNVDLPGDPAGLHVLGPIRTGEGPIVLRPPTHRWHLSPSELQDKKHLERRPQDEICTVHANVVDSETGMPIKGAQLSGGAIHAIVSGRSLGNGELEGWAVPDVLALGVFKDGWKPYPLQHPEIEAGSALSLGTIRMERLRRVPSRLKEADGSEVSSRWQISYSDGGTRRRVLTEADGSFALELAGEPPSSVTVSPEWGAPMHGVSVDLEISSDGMNGSCMAPDWQVVEVHVTGLNTTWRLAPTFLTAKRQDNATARLFRAGTQGEAAVFRAALPPGRWEISSGPLVILTTEPKAISLENGAPALRLEAHAAPIAIR